MTSAYTSDGLLRHVGEASHDTDVFYFSGRPILILQHNPDSSKEWRFLTTDHLGTPILATSETRTPLWRSSFEPFGTDHRAGTAYGASENGIFLRFPGQWLVPFTGGPSFCYSVHRWYEPYTGRYTRVDPLGLYGGPNLFAHVANNPIRLSDPLA